MKYILLFSLFLASIASKSSKINNKTKNKTKTKNNSNKINSNKIAKKYKINCKLNPDSKEMKMLIKIIEKDLG